MDRNQMTRTRLLVAGLFAAPVFLASASAFAADSPGFAYKASELQSDAGAQAVYARMKQEATLTCRSKTSAFAPGNPANACSRRLIHEWIDNTASRRLEQIEASATPTALSASN